MTTLQENSIVTLEVLRQSDMGVFLNGGTGNTNDDILLHKNQQTGDVKVGDKVTVFLYHDPSGRLTASMRLPKIKVGQIGYAPVINTTRFGAFVDVGTERGIFMPFAEMKGRPKEGEYVWVKLYEDKSHRLAVSMEVEDEMRRASRAATDAKVGDWVEGAVYNMTDQGAYLMTRERWIAFLHRSEFNGPILIGQMIKRRRPHQHLPAPDQGKCHQSRCRTYPGLPQAAQGQDALWRQDGTGRHQSQIRPEQSRLQARLGPPHERKENPPGPGLDLFGYIGARAWRARMWHVVGIPQAGVIERFV